MAVVLRSASEYSTSGDSLQFGGSREEVFVRKLITIADGDSDDSQYLVCQLPANAVITDIKLCNSEIQLSSGATQYALGLYQPMNKGGAVIDLDCYMAATSTHAARALGAEVSGVSALSLANAVKRVKELVADITSDVYVSGEDPVFDLVLTAVAASDEDGTVLVEVRYINQA